MTKIASSRTQPRPRSESWNACAVPWKLADTVLGQRLACELLDARDRIAERHARCDVERERDRRQLADVVDRLRADALARRDDRRKRHELVPGACT